MPRSVYRAPFHRRVLPWIFIAIFIVAAPTLIFYTSGYRVNLKKNTIERNGTLIIDSKPTRALIQIDGLATTYRTPDVSQNMAPGPYTVHVSLPGYYPWEKQLEIKAEQVTFANQIDLWKISEPELLRITDADKIEASDDGDLLASHDTQTNTVDFMQPDGSLSASIPLPKGLAATSTPLIRWNQSNTSVLVNGRDAQDPAVLVNADRRSQAELLPGGRYFWNGDSLTGFSDTRSYILDTQQQSLQSAALSDADRGSLDGLTLQWSTTTDSMLIRSGLIVHQLYGLPGGAWQFAGKAKPYELLKQDGNQWLAVRIRATGNDSSRLSGDEPRWLAGASVPTAIFLNGNELWTWKLDSEPQLISRQSTVFVQAVWHPDGGTIFVTDGREVYALELDDRNGRQKTSLAMFDKVYDIAYAAGAIFVAAEQSGERGIWKIAIE